MMKGHILLEGGDEFGGLMAEPDRRAIALAGGVEARICIIPTAAAPDGNDLHAGQNGVRWFRQLGAAQVESLPLIDRAAADQLAIAYSLRQANFIYLLGGFPDYLAKTLSGSSSWQATVQAHQAGAVIGGSSAGAMVLCQHYYEPDTGSIQPGLNLLPSTCLIPHHNTFGKRWVPRLVARVPDDLLLGIDEQTGMIDDAPGGKWTVYGRGVVTIYQGGVKKEYRAGEQFSL